MAIYIEVFEGNRGPLLGLTDGEGSGVEVAGNHCGEWGETLHKFEITKSSAEDIIAGLKSEFNL